MKDFDWKTTACQMADDACDCIIEILESYMEVLTIFDKTMDKDVISNRIKIMAKTLCNERRARWQPFLEELKKKGHIL